MFFFFLILPLDAVIKSGILSIQTISNDVKESSFVSHDDRNQGSGPAQVKMISQSLETAACKIARKCDAWLILGGGQNPAVLVLARG